MADQVAEGLFSPFLRARRIAAARPYLAGRVFDVGCGSGALSRYVDSDRYVGWDPDPDSIGAAHARHPRYCFLTDPPTPEELFDTVVSLTVIEHVPDPVAFLRDLRGRLVLAPESQIVLTTPHPTMDLVHTVGARVGLFSAHASEEHEEFWIGSVCARLRRKLVSVWIPTADFCWGPISWRCFAIWIRVNRRSLLNQRYRSMAKRRMLVEDGIVIGTASVVSLK